MMKKQNKLADQTKYTIGRESFSQVTVIVLFLFISVSIWFCFFVEQDQTSLFSGLASAVLAVLIIKERSAFFQLTVNERTSILIMTIIYAIGWTLGRYFLYFDFKQSLAGGRVWLLIVFVGAVLVFTATTAFCYKMLPNIILYAGKPYLNPVIFIAIIVLGSIVYTVIFFPGASFNDGFRQLYYYYGYNPWTNHDPVFSTMIIGGLHHLFRVLAGDELSFFFYNCVIQILSLLLFGLIIRLFNKNKVPQSICFATALYFAFHPTIRLYSLTLCKDTLFAMATLCMVLILVNIYIRNQENETIHFSVWLILTGTLLLIANLRNDGIYVGLFTCMCLIIFSHVREQKRIVLIIAAFLICFYVCYGQILSIAGIEKGSVREMLSVPLQQTAACLKSYPNDISEEQRNNLEDVFECSLKEVVSNYDPMISDPVKNAFVEKPTNDQMKNYIKTWVSMGVHHPKNYLKTYLNCYYGYLYPDMRGSEVGFPFFWVSDKYRGHFNVSYDYIGSSQEKAYNNIQTIMCVPGFSMLYSPGFYVWVLLFCAMFFIAKKKNSALFCLSPLVCIVLIACMSPVNCRLRYILTLVYALPIMLAFTATGGFDKEAKDTLNDGE